MSLLLGYSSLAGNNCSSKQGQKVTAAATRTVSCGVVSKQGQKVTEAIQLLPPVNCTVASKQGQRVTESSMPVNSAVISKQGQKELVTTSTVAGTFSGAILSGSKLTSGFVVNKITTFPVDLPAAGGFLLKFKADIAGAIVIRTVQQAGGSSLDTVISLFASGSATVLTTDDDGGNGSVAPFSGIAYTVAAGTTYFLLVQGFDLVQAGAFDIEFSGANIFLGSVGIKQGQKTLSTHVRSVSTTVVTKQASRTVIRQFPFNITVASKQGQKIDARPWHGNNSSVASKQVQKNISWLAFIPTAANSGFDLCVWNSDYIYSAYKPPPLDDANRHVHTLITGDFVGTRQLSIWHAVDSPTYTGSYLSIGSASIFTPMTFVWETTAWTFNVNPNSIYYIIISGIALSDATLSGSNGYVRLVQSDALSSLFRYPGYLGTGVRTKQNQKHLSASVSPYMGVTAGTKQGQKSLETSLLGNSVRSKQAQSSAIQMTMPPPAYVSVASKQGQKAAAMTYFGHLAQVASKQGQKTRNKFAANPDSASPNCLHYAEILDLNWYDFACSGLNTSTTFALMYLVTGDFSGTKTFALYTTFLDYVATGGYSAIYSYSYASVDTPDSLTTVTGVGPWTNITATPNTIYYFKAWKLDPIEDAPDTPRPWVHVSYSVYQPSYDPTLFRLPNFEYGDLHRSKQSQKTLLTVTPWAVCGVSSKQGQKNTTAIAIGNIVSIKQAQRTLAPAFTLTPPVFATCSTKQVQQGIRNFSISRAVSILSKQGQTIKVLPIGARQAQASYAMCAQAPAFLSQPPFYVTSLVNVDHFDTYTTRCNPPFRSGYYMTEQSIAYTFTARATGTVGISVAIGGSTFGNKYNNTFDGDVVVYKESSPGVWDIMGAADHWFGNSISSGAPPRILWVQENQSYIFLIKSLSFNYPPQAFDLYMTFTQDSPWWLAGYEGSYYEYKGNPNYDYVQGYPPQILPGLHTINSTSISRQVQSIRHTSAARPVVSSTVAPRHMSRFEVIQASGGMFVRSKQGQIGYIYADIENVYPRQGVGFPIRPTAQGTYPYPATAAGSTVAIRFTTKDSTNVIIQRTKAANLGTGTDNNEWIKANTFGFGSDSQWSAFGDTTDTVSLTMFCNAGIEYFVQFGWGQGDTGYDGDSKFAQGPGNLVITGQTLDPFVANHTVQVTSGQVNTSRSWIYKKLSTSNVERGAQSSGVITNDLQPVFIVMHTKQIVKNLSAHQTLVPQFVPVVSKQVPGGWDMAFTYPPPVYATVAAKQVQNLLQQWQLTPPVFSTAWVPVVQSTHATLGRGRGVSVVSKQGQQLMIAGTLGMGTVNFVVTSKQGQSEYTSLGRSSTAQGVSIKQGQRVASTHVRSRVSAAALKQIQQELANVVRLAPVSIVTAEVATAVVVLTRMLAISVSSAQVSRAVVLIPGGSVETNGVTKQGQHISVDAQRTVDTSGHAAQVQSIQLDTVQTGIPKRVDSKQVQTSQSAYDMHYDLPVVTAQGSKGYAFVVLDFSTSGLVDLEVFDDIFTLLQTDVIITYKVSEVTITYNYTVEPISLAPTDVSIELVPTDIKVL